jgi:hypothetical protein
MAACIRSLLAGVLVAGLTACGVSDAGPVEQIDRRELGDLGETVPASTSTTVVTLPTPPVPTTAVPTVNVPLYFIVGNQLTSLPFALAADPSHRQVLAALQVGPPPGGAGAGLRSAVPRQPDLLPTVSDDGTGVATIDLPPMFFDAIQPTSDQRLAIAQIARTMLERPGIGQVRFTLGGEPTGVPRGNGEIAAPGSTLSRIDFDVLLVDAPPTTTTTTTIAPAESVPADGAPAESVPAESVPVDSAPAEGAP